MQSLEAETKFPECAQVWEWLKAVSYSEVPVLAILDLGIVRARAVSEAGECTVTITPTYSGCPAMDVIGMNIRMAVEGRGFIRVPPAGTWIRRGGKEGVHSEHIGYILAEMQYMQRAYPGMEW